MCVGGNLRGGEWTSWKFYWQSGCLWQWAGGQGGSQVRRFAVVCLSNYNCFLFFLYWENILLIKQLYYYYRMQKTIDSSWMSKRRVIYIYIYIYIYICVCVWICVCVCVCECVCVCMNICVCVCVCMNMCVCVYIYIYIYIYIIYICVCVYIYIYIYMCVYVCVYIYIYIYIYICMCVYRHSWCNGFHHKKWTWQPKFKSWMRLFAFHIALIVFGEE